MTGGVGEPLLDFAEQLQSIHPRHVDVGQDREQLRLDFIVEKLNGLITDCAKCST
jgi:hypothetical protein